MGLLLSILVTCVGVAELFTLCCNVRRRVTCSPVEGSLAVYHTRQIHELEGIRDNLSKQLQQLQGHHNAEPTQTMLNRPTLRLNSHEDIEIQLNEGVIARSRSPSPRRFLVSENKHSHNVATRQFVVTEEPQAVQKVQKSKAQECLPEYLIEEATSNREVPRYVLKDGVNPVPLPLPEKFVVSEKEPDLEVKSDVFRRKLGHNVVEVDGEIYYERCPSPFPSFDLTVPRNSICSELLDDASVAEVDERSRSSSPLPPGLTLSSSHTCSYSESTTSEKIEGIMTAGTTAHSSKEYWSNTVLVVPTRKSKSRSTSPALKQIADDHKPEPLSSNINEVNCSLSDDDENNLEVQSYTDNLKDSLDGVGRNKGGIKKKLMKNKKNKNQQGRE